MGAHLDGIVALWAATLHQISDYQVRSAGGRASFTAVLTATHVHRVDDPGAHLRIGATLGGAVVRMPAGARLEQIEIALAWTEGDGPTPIA